MRRLLAPLVALAAFGLAPSDAEAAPKTNDLDRGLYVIVSPGLFGIDVADDDRVGRDIDINYQASAGIGYLWSPSRKLKASIGVGVEHMLDHVSPDRLWLRFLPEFRIGGGNDRLFIYGLVGAGGAMVIQEYPQRIDDEYDAYGGFGLQFGGGAQVVVWKGLAVGGELDTDVVWVFDPDFTNVTVGIEAILAWYF